MLSLVKIKDGKVCLVSTDEPTLQEGHVLIKTKYIGLCRTDLYVADGKIPISEDRVLGHEFSGVVIASNNGSTFTVGDTVSCNPLLNDGFLGLDIDGALTEIISVPETHVIKMSWRLSLKEMAYLEPIAAITSLSKKSTQIIDLLENNTNIIGIYGKNRIAELTRIFLESFGVTTYPVTNYSASSTFDIIIETSLTNNDDVMDILADKLVTDGTLIIKSRPNSKISFTPINFLKKELNIKALFYGDFVDAAEWLADNKDRISHLLGDEYDLVDYQLAFDAANRDEGKKIFIRMPD